MEGNKRIAVFDFCETIADYQTADPFISFVINRYPKTSSLVYFAIIRFLQSIRVTKILGKLFPNSSVNKRLVAFCLRGYKKCTLWKAGKEYYDEVVKKHLIQRVINEIADLQEYGYRIYIVSGGYCFYISAFATDFGVPQGNIICNSFRFSNNKCTGAFEGKDCLGEEKVLRLKGLIGDEQVDLSYSDSATDTPILNYAQEGIIIRNINKLSWDYNNKYKEIVWE